MAASEPSYVDMMNVISGAQVMRVTRSWKLVYVANPPPLNEKLTIMNRGPSSHTPKIVAAPTQRAGRTSLKSLHIRKNPNVAVVGNNGESSRIPAPENCFPATRCTRTSGPQNASAPPSIVNPNAFIRRPNGTWLAGVVVIIDIIVSRHPSASGRFGACREPDLNSFRQVVRHLVLGQRSE